jgi:hypothetical protein
MKKQEKEGFIDLFQAVNPGYTFSKANLQNVPL